MMKGGLVVAAVALALVSLASLAEAGCPNACSGHGQCGQYDQCTCHVDWVGGDCSERACPINWAWATTNSNGDLNGDGDRDDITVYDSDHYFSSSGISYVTSQQDPHGAWEQWPAYGNTASKDEGHFYMECSNRGVCDRSTGECECFDGYTGAGCRRTECPNECTGHGVCQTVAQQKGANAYTLWDADMSRSCVCDSGYSGADCSERKCPVGDDPLTTSDTTEVQWVDIYTDRDGTDDRTFAGSIRLTYTDEFGKTWETDSVAVEPYTSSASDMATNVAAALNALPNDVLSGVTVTQSYIERVIPGNLEVTTNAFTAATTSGTSLDLTGLLVRCPETTADQDKVAYSSDGADMLQYEGSAYTMTDLDDMTCFEVDHQWGVRFEVSFPNSAGNLPAMGVDISAVTIGGLTNAQRGNTLVAGAVAGTRVLGSHAATGGITMEYTHPDAITHTCNGAASCGVVGSTKTVSVTANSDAITFVAGSRVKITCNGIVRGTFTVDAPHVSAATLTVVEDISDCTLGAGEDIIVAMQSSFVTANADLTGMLAAGDILSVDTFSGTSPVVSSVNWVEADGVSHVFFASTHVGDDASSAETVTTAGTDYVYQQGDATSEGDECAGRGLCDRERGICQCFKGYTGAACTVQNALSLNNE